MKRLEKVFLVLLMVFVIVWPWGERPWTWKVVMGAEISSPPLTAAQIIKRQKELYRVGLENEEEWDEMIIKDSNGVRERSSVSWIRFDPAGDDIQIVKILTPAQKKGVTVLIFRNLLKADEEWSFVPAFRKKRKEALNIYDNIAETDFTLFDLEQLTGGEDGIHSYKLLGEENFEGQPCWIIEAAPKNKKGNPYSKRIIRIRRDNFFLVGCEYFGKDGKLLKSQKNLQITRPSPMMHPDLWRMGVIWTKHLITGREITRRIKKRVFNLNLPDNFFTVENLERLGLQE